MPRPIISSAFLAASWAKLVGRIAREQLPQSSSLLVGEQVGSGVQGLVDVVERVAFAAAVPVSGLLYASSAQVSISVSTWDWRLS